MARRGKLTTTPTQRILITHIIGLSASLALALMGGVWLWLSLVIAVALTIMTVARLVVARTARIVFTRALEPLAVVVFVLLYIALLTEVYGLPLWQQAGLLLVAFAMQVRFFLLQFRSRTPHLQTGYSLLLIVLANTLWMLIASQNAFFGFATLILAWLVNYVIVHYWLERVGYHNSFLAAVWAILAVEVLMISQMALVFYTLPSTNLVVSRSAVILAVIAYAWGSMLHLHAQRKLSKKLVVEYGMMCAFLLGFLLFMSGM